jgi:hypothetical protein
MLHIKSVNKYFVHLLVKNNKNNFVQSEHTGYPEHLASTACSRFDRQNKTTKEMLISVKVPLQCY